MANILAIVGRPNVGKSTLFNRLVEQRDAIVDNVSGVTRDRHYGKGEWCGKFFTVIDTGGYVVGSDDIFEGAIREQVEIAIEEATVLLFVVDCDSGLLDLDREFANVLRRSKKPVYVVANKADNTERLHASAEFYELAIGEGEVFPIAAISGSGTGELLDAVIENFTDEPLEEEDEATRIPRISIVGRPNVGKSSFVNALLNRTQSIVTNIAGTTRDSIDSLYNSFGKKFILTDTAGIRRKSRIKENIEFYSILRSIKAIEEADVCIVVIDATQGLDAQDMGIIHLAQRNRKGIVLMVNKWDLVEKDTNTARKFEAELKERLSTLGYVPIIFTSVLEKQRIFKAVDTAIQVFDNKRRKITTSALNEVMLKEIEAYPPPSVRGKHVKIKYITQLPTKSPTFAFFCNHPKDVRQPYERFLENKMRANFELDGVPINIVFRQK